MHHCETFREKITEQIIDREDIAANPQFQTELLLCSGCAEFYAESREMIEALDGLDLATSERQWKGIELRLHAAILEERNYNLQWTHRPVQPLSKRKNWINRAAASFWSTSPFWASAAVLLLITVGLSRLPELVPDTPRVVYVEHTVPLDPVTVDFLEESELLLRNVMKIAPSDMEDLAQAKRVAGEQLAELQQRKEAAAEVLPVVGVMETYETVLRDIRNVDERSPDADIGDIQKRIQQNGLIPNMKAFQPRLTEVSFSLQ